MGRHTGFCFLLLPALLLSLRGLGSSRCSDAAGEPTDRPETVLVDSALPRPGASAASLPLNSETRRFLLIGSRDLSGAPHSVTLHVGEVHALQSQRESSTRPSGFARNRQHVNLASHAQRPWAQPPSVNSAAAANVNHGSEVASDSQPIFRAPEHSTSPDSVRIDPPSKNVTRRFLVPQFQLSGTRDALIDAKLVLQTARMQVFFGTSEADSPLGQFADSQQIRQLADQVCSLAEHEALPLVHKWIGPVTDLDQDDRLTIVLTSIDLRPNNSGIPVFGCVRPADFVLTDVRDFGGDIIYLDLRIPLEELPGLLVHELTHAAILSQHPPDAAEAESVPAWLNEAVAHVMERQVQLTSASFESRLADFRKSPWRCPIVANEDYLLPGERRRGTRAAGALFLAQLVDNPAQMREVLASASSPHRWISRISGRSTDDVLIEWWTSQAVHCNPHKSSGMLSLQNTQITVSLYGTSFVLIPIDPSVNGVTIDSDAAAEIQCRLLDWGATTFSVTLNNSVRHENSATQ
jgi:hypothetical protein